MQNFVYIKEGNYAKGCKKLKEIIENELTQGDELIEGDLLELEEPFKPRLTSVFKFRSGSKWKIVTKYDLLGRRIFDEMWIDEDISMKEYRESALFLIWYQSEMGRPNIIHFF